MDAQRTNQADAQTRRRFVCGMLAGSAAFAGLSCAPSREASGARTARTGGGSSRRLGVALLGLGNYSETQLAPALAQTRHCSLRGVVTGTPGKAARWQRQHQLPDRNLYDYASLPRIADNPDIDVVYVVVPTALHAKYAIMAAEAGKHVWCEKPMAMTSTECEAIIAACRKSRVSLSIGYRLHHEPNTRTVMQIAREKPYGALTQVRAVVGDRSDGADSWRMRREMGGGALYDLGVYSINAIRYGSGEEPARVLSARQWAERPALFRDVDECSEFELELPSGARCYGKASCADSENLLRAQAERGWYQLEPMQTYEGVRGETSDGRRLDQPIDRQQTRQLDDDALAILERRPALVPGEEGLRDIRVVESILVSAQKGAPVAL